MSTPVNLVVLQDALYTSRNPTRRWLHTQRREWILSALERHRPSPCRRALEIGPGSGTYLPALCAMAGEVFAADIEDAYLERAKSLTARLPNLRLVKDDITASQLPTGQFDLILCSEVIEHVPGPAQGIREMHRLLRPGGMLVLSTPQKYSTIEMISKIALRSGFIELVRFFYREPIVESTHHNLLTARACQRSIADAGFSVVERHKLALYLPFVAELTGRAGLRVEQWFESHLRGTPLDGLLWSQCYVARA
jgi:2-polyprenyl-3-methyl-5-hydroxy-6-metoxy-1,4-benzoquinol methylase